MFRSESVLNNANNPAFKKKLCIHFAKGRCNIGAECGFAHGKDELRNFENPGFKAQLCTAYDQDGICEMGIDCLFAHGESELRNDSPGQLNGITGVINGTAELKKEAYKSSLCIHFMRSGSCKVGTGCAFAHGKEDLVNAKSPDTSDPKYKTKLCIRFEQDSFCPNGDGCVFAHGELELREAQGSGGSKSASLFKTSLCHNFTTLGVCPNGKNCSFAHGRYELRPVGFDGDFDAKIAENRKWKCTLCNIFQQAGRCNRTSCDYAHGEEELRSENPEPQQPKAKGNFKTVLCKNFQARGFCFHEDSCNFAHGEVELNQAKDALTTMKMLRKRPKEEMHMNGKGGASVATGANAVAPAASGFDQKLFAEFLEFKKFKQQSESTAAASGPTSFYPSGPTTPAKNKQQNMQYPTPVPPTTSVAEMETQGYYQGGFQTTNMGNSNGMHTSGYHYSQPMGAYNARYGGTNQAFGGSNAAYGGTDGFASRRIGDRMHSDYGF